MKALHWFVFVFLAVVLVAALLPAPVSAEENGSITITVDAATKLAKIRLSNKTGGVLVARLSGPYSYSFSTAQQGKWTSAAIIQPGKYKITLTTSACGGSFNLSRNVKGGTIGTPTLVCRKK